MYNYNNVANNNQYNGVTATTDNTNNYSSSYSQSQQQCGSAIHQDSYTNVSYDHLGGTTYGYNVNQCGTTNSSLVNNTDYNNGNVGSTSNNLNFKGGPGQKSYNNCVNVMGTYNNSTSVGPDNNNNNTSSATMGTLSSGNLNCNYMGKNMSGALSQNAQNYTTPYGSGSHYNNNNNLVTQGSNLSNNFKGNNNFSTSNLVTGSFSSVISGSTNNFGSAVAGSSNNNKGTPVTASHGPTSGYNNNNNLYNNNINNDQV